MRKKREGNGRRRGREEGREKVSKRKRIEREVKRETEGIRKKAILQNSKY